MIWALSIFAPSMITIESISVYLWITKDSWLILLPQVPYFRRHLDMLRSTGYTGG
jgi:hypothetical protein